MAIQIESLITSPQFEGRVPAARSDDVHAHFHTRVRPDRFSSISVPKNAASHSQYPARRSPPFTASIPALQTLVTKYPVTPHTSEQLTLLDEFPSNDLLGS